MLSDSLILQEKRESPYSLLVPRFEALVLPLGVERATQKPHADMLYISLQYSRIES